MPLPGFSRAFRVPCIIMHCTAPDFSVLVFVFGVSPHSVLSRPTGAPLCGASAFPPCSLHPLGTTATRGLCSSCSMSSRHCTASDFSVFVFVGVATFCGFPSELCPSAVECVSAMCVASAWYYYRSHVFVRCSSMSSSSMFPRGSVPCTSSCSCVFSPHSLTPLVCRLPPAFELFSCSCLRSRAEMRFARPSWPARVPCPRPLFVSVRQIGACV